MITFRNVFKEYSNGVQALKDVNLEIPYGEFVFIVGASGAGKSSLIKLLICEEKVTRGHIFVNEKDITELAPWYIPKLRRRVGVVFQDFRLLQKKTAYENVAYALEIVGESGRTIKKRVPEVLELVGLSDKQNSYPGELSGGEGQRLAIARAIVNRPPVLVCDEPTGNLDFETAMTIMQTLKRINEDGATVIMATHARNIVNHMNRRVITLDDGRVISDVNVGGYDAIH
ncbi:cell division ATP-binding protein FtsE [Aedoeadaptatus coxii]|uniref:Cell division ATP-binding protein FtsE n=1 Tax=Aedoeadaptatus coxii TaxID=755172 RepID=A0A134ACW4_9FIRM|nr:cell division ATP-binding protein FtsE [Peptoniphilus coxii]KXB65557.1 cell division ATP-binding protein FtsE [Peptoniphilus coxii]CAC9927766.1 cell division ATP-binding protein FtsE [Peptoniphilus coxii]